MIYIARLKNPNREKAFEIYLKNKGNIKPSSIAKELNEKAANIRTWKHVDKWDDKLPKAGAPKGNKNAKGNKGGGAPKGNLNNVKHGMYMGNDRFIDKWGDILPKSITNNLKLSSGESPLDIQWRNIVILDAKIMSSHKIMEVKSSNDHTKEIKKVTSGNFESKEYEIMFAQDKEMAYGRTLSQMKKTLNDMIKSYLELVNKTWDLDKEEKELRVEKLRYELKTMNNDEEIEDDGFIEALKSEVEKIWD